MQNDNGLDFVQAIEDEYNNAPYEFNAGAFGAVIGWLLLTMGKAPAIIVDLLLIFLVIMFTSKLTVNQFFKTTAKPVKKAVEKATPYIEERRERRKSNIDVYLDDEPPTDAEAKKPEKKIKKAKNQPENEQEDEQTDDYSKLINEINQTVSRNRKAREDSKSLDEIVKEASEEKTSQKKEPEQFTVSEEEMNEIGMQKRYVVKKMSNIIETVKKRNKASTN